MKPAHPLAKALADWLPEADVGVMKHGFADHGRDYVIEIENSLSYKPGLYELTFTHVVELSVATRVRDDVWPASWSDEFIDYRAWEGAGHPEGYVWGTNWSLAYPGFRAIEDSAESGAWTNRLSRPMHAMTLETDRFFLSMIFHDLRVSKLSDAAPTVSSVLTPLLP